MNVTIYKNLKDVSQGYDKPITYVLERIKNGNSKDKIEYLRSVSKEIYQKEKNIIYFK